MSAAEHPAGRSFLSIVTRGSWQLGVRAAEGTRQPPGWGWGWVQGWDRPAEDRGRRRQPRGVMPGWAVRGAMRRARGGRQQQRGRLRRYLGFREVVLAGCPAARRSGAACKGTSEPALGGCVARACHVGSPSGVSPHTHSCSPQAATPSPVSLPTSLHRSLSVFLSLFAKNLSLRSFKKHLSAVLTLVGLRSGACGFNTHSSQWVRLAKVWRAPAARMRRVWVCVRT